MTVGAVVARRRWYGAKRIRGYIESAIGCTSRTR